MRADYNAAAMGLINLIYNLARYEQMVRLKVLLSEPESLRGVGSGPEAA